MNGYHQESRSIHFIHEIVQKYEKAAASHYGAQKQSKSKFTGRFDFKNFAKKCFDSIEAEQLEVTYLEMCKDSVLYMHMYDTSHTGARGFPQSLLSIPELLLNMILAYQLPQQKSNSSEVKIDCNTEDEDLEEHGNETRRKSRNNENAGPRVALSNQLTAKLFEEMLKIQLPTESKVWKQAKYILCPSNCKKQLSEFGEIIKKTTDAGLISFTALNFFMSDPTLNQHFEEPTTILQALYMGPLGAQTVEMFARNRSESFRKSCREVLRIALEATRDSLKFKHYEPENILTNTCVKISYRNFADNVNKLIYDLSGDVRLDSRIHVGWARAAVKKYGQKRYVDKTWEDENLYDLIWTVLAQRPQLKPYVIDILEKNFKDQNAARFWRRMQPYQMNPTSICNENVKREDPLKPTDKFLNFLPDVREIKMISSEKELQDFKMLLEYRVSREEIVIVGVDAEWSAYVNQSQATILQIALFDSVYIVDLESSKISPNTYNQFFSYFFDTAEIVKIGFQFGEDLHQLRTRFRNCRSLYAPKSVMCVGKLIMDLMAEIGKHPNKEQLKTEWLPFLENDSPNQKKGAGKSNDDENGAADQSTSRESIGEGSTGGEVKNNRIEANKNQFSNKGLSYICENILGRPLDKTEQCSVWDRRPLRDLQIRYAAMDAYCLLLLYKKCGQVYQSLGLDVMKYLQKQSPIIISLPLLSEEPL
uniref:3'-5' exonuclease domain-containing protein n=1 Tax=Caenorhabditis japonica TaxID=281687 RepID=A0A8R1HJ29_CAEJA